MIDDNNQIADQLQLHERPPEDPYGLPTSSYKKQTAQKIIYGHLMKAASARLQEKLKDESDRAGPGSTEQLRYRIFLSNRNDTSGLWLRPSMTMNNHRLSNEEFIAAVCKRNTIDNPGIPKLDARQG